MYGIGGNKLDESTHANVAGIQVSTTSENRLIKTFVMVGPSPSLRLGGAAEKYRLY